jgi:type IV fimbrial biogenesis protein FimT
VVIALQLPNAMETRQNAAIGRPALRRQAGFTLIELMVVLTISAILAFLAAPSMSRLIATQRVKAAAEDLHLSLLRARSEAIKRNTGVTLSAVAGDWSQGWTIPDPEGGSSLHDHSSSGSVSIASGVTSVSYTANGRLSTAAPTFVLTNTGTDAARCVSVEPSGRPYAKEGTSC